VRRVGCDEGSIGGARCAKRRLEERKRSFTVPARAAQPSSFEVDSRRRKLARPGEARRLVEDLVSRVEVLAQPVDACELGECLGALGA
jgi:hypothetical protein